MFFVFYQMSQSMCMMMFFKFIFLVFNVYGFWISFFKFRQLTYDDVEWPFLCHHWLGCYCLWIAYPISEILITLQCAISRFWIYITKVKRNKWFFVPNLLVRNCVSVLGVIRTVSEHFSGLISLNSSNTCNTTTKPVCTTNSYIQHNLHTTVFVMMRCFSVLS